MIVVDEQGNEYEATYPKRAKGLVKNGRARFVDENRICLACPPYKLMEDNEMTKINEPAISEKKSEDMLYTIGYALGQLEKVRSEASAFFTEMSKKLMEIQSGGPGDVGAQAKGMAFQALVEEQGSFYRKLIDFYIGMISDLKKDAPRA